MRHEADYDRPQSGRDGIVYTTSDPSYQFAPSVHPTGSEPVMVATFTGVHEYVPFDLRPYPEQIEAKVSTLAAQLILLRQEVASMRVQMLRLEAGHNGNQ